MKVGVLLPAYNEEKNIRQVIKEAKKYFPNSKILVVDDGSTDRTYELAKKTGVKVLKHEENKGKGEALKTGFNYFLKSNVDFVVVADTDRQYSIREAPRLTIPLKEGADFVTGYRDWKEVPPTHGLFNFVWRFSFNLFFGTNFKDTNCGFMALTKNAIRKISGIHGGYIIENALFIEAIKHKFKIKQVPVTVRYKGTSSFLRGFRMVLGVFIFILKEGLKYRLRIK